MPLLKDDKGLLDIFVVLCNNSLEVDTMRIVNCERKHDRRHRRTVSITMDPHILDGLRQWMKKEGETNLSAVIEGFIDCGIRDTCEGCPYDEEGQEKVGVGKIESKGTGAE